MSATAADHPAAETLARSSMLADFSEAERLDVASILAPVSFAAGEVIFQEGDLGDRMLLIQEGTVGLSKRVAGGGRIALAEIGPGGLTGEMSMVDGSPRSATATAHGAVRAFAANRRDFNAHRTAGTIGIRKLMRIIAEQACGRVLALADTLDVRLPEPAAALDPARARPARLPPPEVIAALPLVGSSHYGELAQLFDDAQAWDLNRGEQLAPREGQRNTVFLVLQGAIEARLSRPGRTDLVEIMPPGSLIGACGLLTGRDSPAAYVARETTTVVAFSATRAQACLAGTNRVDFLFRDLICRQAFYDLRSTNRRQAWLAAVDSGFIRG